MRIQCHNKGVATVYGTVLLVILVVTLASLLFVGLSRYNQMVQGALTLEDERLQEEIALQSLKTVSDANGTEYISAILVNNTGAITVRIRALYVNEVFVCDPSDPLLNPTDTYINPQTALWVQIPSTLVYVPDDKLAVATERGIKSIEYAAVLKNAGGGSQPPSDVLWYFGPLMLDFDKFYYREVDSAGAFIPSSVWKPGWKVEVGSGTIAWNITVKNVDYRNITLNEYSCLTLWPNDSPSNRRAWYLEPIDGTKTQFIAVNETANLIYIWKTPKTVQQDPRSVYTTVCRNRVFLTFFGTFHELDFSTKPYGQTIPFEAVICARTEGTLTMTASPFLIYTNSTSNYSTISVILRDLEGNVPISSVTVFFATDLGTLSSPWAITDANGQVNVTLSAIIQAGTDVATISASWAALSNTTEVIFTDGRPVAMFSVDATTASTYEVLSFDASNSYDADGWIESYLWDFGDGNTNTGISPTHFYSDNGFYTVTLIVIDNDGEVNTTSQSITIVNQPPTAGVFVNATVVLTGEGIAFDASDSSDVDGTIVSYLWDFGDGNTAMGLTATHTYTDNGTYPVTLTVTDDDVDTGIIITLITVENQSPLPSFTVNPSPPVSTGLLLTFNASESSDSDGSIISYDWDYGDGNSGSGVTSTYTYTTPGTYLVTLTVTDDDGASVSTTQSVEVTG
jgi:PKD repeat protein